MLDSTYPPAGRHERPGPAPRHRRPLHRRPSREAASPGPCPRARLARQSDEKPVRGVAGTEAEGGRKRILLGSRQPLQRIQRRRAQLVQPGVGELHLRLDAGSTGNPGTRGCLGRVPQKRGLANARLAAHDQHAALARARRPRAGGRSRALGTAARSTDQPRASFEPATTRPRINRARSCECVDQGARLGISPVTPRGERHGVSACSVRDRIHAINERSEHGSH